MAKVLKNRGRNLAVTIIVGVFISIMLITLVNLIVSYAYPAPLYNDFCTNSDYYSKPYLPSYAANCTFNRELDNSVNACTSQGGMPVYNYDDNGCAISPLKLCDFCAKTYEGEINSYNRVSFFVFALIGFALIVFGLMASTLLLQIVALPAGAILVIEAAVKNFDDKLAVIIVLSLLVIAALYLALKKLR